MTVHALRTGSLTGAVCGSTAATRIIALVPEAVTCRACLEGARCQRLVERRPVRDAFLDGPRRCQLDACHIGPCDPDAATRDDSPVVDQ